MHASHPPPVMKSTLAGEYEVATLMDVIHFNTVEVVTGQAAKRANQTNGGSNDTAYAVAPTTTSSSIHQQAALTQTSSTFWKGNLFLTNYALNFLVTEGHSHGVTHPNHETSHQSLLHIPVGSIWKMEYNKYTPVGGRTKEDKERERQQAERENGGGGGGDYSGLGSSTIPSHLIVNPTTTDSDLKDVAFQLTLHCRDARVLSFGILKKTSAPTSTLTGVGIGVTSVQSLEDRQTASAEFMRLLKKYAFPKEVKKLFAFSYSGGGTSSSSSASASASASGASKDKDGWHIYDIHREFVRMGIGSHPGDTSLGLSLVHPRRRCKWRLDTTTNAKFDFSPTYPAAFWLPIELNEKELTKVKSFRSKGRLPALVYNYSDLLDYAGLGLDPLTYPDTVILRSAQPNVGWTFGRCQADETLLALAEVRVIIDARPYANAVANQAKGGGYENAENYQDCRIEFMNIENIHVMRNSLDKLLDTLRSNYSNNYTTGGSNSQTGDEFWGAIQQSGWLKHMRILLEGSAVCANYVKNGQSILIHCSDGWDRTSQLTSLAQLLLDPYYRTRHGFGVLVEKEWIAFGHQFQKRCGHGEKDTHHADERSPIFVQFLDAVWQVMQQFPFAFEFNAEYLTAIADHLYSNKFGTFLGDNERQRHLDRIRESTQSLWTELNSDARKKQFKNTLYNKSGLATIGPSVVGAPSVPLTGAELGKASFLHLSPDPRKIGIWPYWYRWETRRHHPHGLGSIHDSLMAYTKSALSQEKSRAHLREGLLIDTITSMEHELQRLEALLKTRSHELNQTRAELNQPPVTIPSTFRTTPTFKVEQFNQTVMTALQQQQQLQQQSQQLQSTSHQQAGSLASSSIATPNQPLPSPLPSNIGNSSHSVRSSPPPVPANANTGGGGMTMTPNPLHPPQQSQQQHRNSVSGTKPPAGPMSLNSVDTDGDSDVDEFDPNPMSMAEHDAALSTYWESNPLPHGRDSFVINPLLATGLGPQHQHMDEDDFGDGDLFAANAVDPRKRSIFFNPNGTGAGVGARPPPPPPNRMVALPGMSIAPKHRSLFEFTATSDEQLTIARGEVVEVVDKTSVVGWWKVRSSRGGEGLVPTNRMEQLPITTAVVADGDGISSPSSSSSISSSTTSSSYTSPSVTGHSYLLPKPRLPPPPTSTSTVGPTPPPIPSMPPSSSLSQASTTSLSNDHESSGTTLSSNPSSTTSSTSSTPSHHPHMSPPSVGPVGPQFRLNADIFSGLKLKSTPKKRSSLIGKQEALATTTPSAPLPSSNNKTSPSDGSSHGVSKSTVGKSTPPAIPAPTKAATATSNSSDTTPPSVPASNAPETSASEAVPIAPLATATAVAAGSGDDEEEVIVGLLPVVPPVLRPMSSSVSTSLLSSVVTGSNDLEEMEVIAPTVQPILSPTVQTMNEPPIVITKSSLPVVPIISTTPPTDAMTTTATTTTTPEVTTNGDHQSTTVTTASDDSSITTTVGADTTTHAAYDDDDDDDIPITVAPPSPPRPRTSIAAVLPPPPPPSSIPIPSDGSSNNIPPPPPPPSSDDSADVDSLTMIPPPPPPEESSEEYDSTPISMTVPHSSIIPPVMIPNRAFSFDINDLPPPPPNQ